VKKGWVLLLLISLGLNFGLGLRLTRLGDPVAPLPAGGPDGPGWQEHAAGRWQRPAPTDTTAWRQFMGRRIDHLAARLDLRPEQIARFQATQKSTGRLMRGKRHELWQIRIRLRELMTAENIDGAAVRQAMAEMGRRQAEMDSLAAETVLGELEILDPDQRSNYLDFLPDGAGRHAGRGRRGRDMPGR